MTCGSLALPVRAGPEGPGENADTLATAVAWSNKILSLIQLSHVFYQNLGNLGELIC